MVEGGGRRVLVRIDENKLSAFCIYASIPEVIGLLNPMGRHFRRENLMTQIAGKKAHGALIVCKRALRNNRHRQ